MHEKRVPVFLFAMILLIVLNQPIYSQAQTSLSNNWQIENKGGQYKESNGILSLWSEGGVDCPAITIYKQIKPMGNFSFSVDVNAQVAESCGIFVKSGLPMAGRFNGFNFEYGHYGASVFLLARNFSDWMTDQIAYGEPNAWYTMRLDVTAEPFIITTSVFDANGSLIGSFSTSNIVNFTFEDINYLGLSVWGYSPSSYLFQNIKDPFANPASLSIAAQSTSRDAGSAVNVFGTLLDTDNVPLRNKTIVLSYSFPGANSWIPISSALTDERGEYSVQWINSASGTFTLKVYWSGDLNYTATSNTTTLNFLPYQNQQLFLVESNSTVNGLFFDNQTSTLSFNVTGQSGSTGYVRATIAKNLLSNVEHLQVYLDSKPINYTVTSNQDFWVFTFDYSHSTHKVTINLASDTSSPQMASDIFLAVIIAALITVLAFELKSWIKPKYKSNSGSPDLLSITNYV